MATILVTGGAGYIGSHTVRHLVRAGHRVVVLDDLSSGHREALAADVPLVVTPVHAAASVVAKVEPAAVIHFAGAIEPGLSMHDPRRFWNTNLAGGVALVDALIAKPVPVVFSSTSATYGEPSKLPMSEDDPTVPTSPYGASKLAFERVLRAYDAAYGLRSMSLRYFNAAGAAPEGDIGADHRHKVHIITRAILTVLGRIDHLDVYGDDYPTPDGTAIRDYVHVEDLADAHLVAVEALLDGAPSDVCNVGVGRGYSVAEVVDAVERISGQPVKRQIGPRRPGDPSRTISDVRKIKRVLGWEARYRDLDDMIASAWRWHSSHPDGFSS